MVDNIAARLHRAIRGLKQVEAIKRFVEGVEFAACRSRPFFQRTVPTEFDAIAVRVVNINGLADAMIACAINRDIRGHHASQRIGERGSCWIKGPRCDLAPWPLQGGGEPPRLCKVLSAKWWW